VRRSPPVAEYVASVVLELRARVGEQPGTRLSTIYLGGGTPSKLGSRGVFSIVEAILGESGLQLESSAEITLEANPEDVSAAAASAWLAAGVTRLSLGVQSFDNRVLDWMHRTHDADAARRAVFEARTAGFDNISMDLIFALPRSLERSWLHDLEQALALRPDHLSLYGLTVEHGTALGKWTARGEVVEAPEDSYAVEFLQASSSLAEAGFEQYEVSNFARPARRSCHNAAYWKRVPYLGVGPSAHSFDGVERRWNEREYASWKSRVLGGEDPVAGSERLTAANESAEVVYLGLRTSDGLREAPPDRATVDEWVQSGWARRERGQVRLTSEGWLRLDSLATALTAARSR
jgi:oxygen-independent coproporphyrinogen-3 oxidase